MVGNLKKHYTHFSYYLIFRLSCILRIKEPKRNILGTVVNRLKNTICGYIFLFVGIVTNKTISGHPQKALTFLNFTMEAPFLVSKGAEKVYLPGKTKFAIPEPSSAVVFTG